MSKATLLVKGVEKPPSRPLKFTFQDKNACTGGSDD